MSEVTQILDRVREGKATTEDLLPLVYGELRRLAARRLAGEAPGQTLQPTALVHEAWLRLGGDSQPNWKNNGHFFYAASEAMRRILVENARRKLSLKRGGGSEKTEFEESAIAAPADDEKILQVHAALETLAEEDPEKAQIVKLRFFAGFNHQEIAAMLAINEKTVRRHWEIAKLKLFDAISAMQQ